MQPDHTRYSERTEWIGNVIGHFHQDKISPKEKLQAVQNAAEKSHLSLMANSPLNALNNQVGRHVFSIGNLYGALSADISKYMAASGEIDERTANYALGLLMNIHQHDSTNAQNVEFIERGGRGALNRAILFPAGGIMLSVLSAFAAIPTFGATLPLVPVFVTAGLGVGAINGLQAYGIHQDAKYDVLVQSRHIASAGQQALTPADAGLAAQSNTEQQRSLPEIFAGTHTAIKDFFALQAQEEMNAAMRHHHMHGHHHHF
ncbi:hypothetical protein GC177_00785 [bacterium]|nr:hypothetical protein [bacterium]